MPSKYNLGYDAGMEMAMPAVIKLLDKLADARRDSAEWKEQHENLLAMFRTSENRAAQAETRAEAMAKAHAWLLANYDTCGLEYYSGQYEYYSAKLPGRHFATMKELVDTAIEQGAQHG